MFWLHLWNLLRLIVLHKKHLIFKLIKSPFITRCSGFILIFIQKGIFIANELPWRDIFFERINIWQLFFSAPSNFVHETNKKLAIKSIKKVLQNIFSFISFRREQILIFWHNTRGCVPKDGKVPRPRQLSPYCWTESVAKSQLILF